MCPSLAAARHANAVMGGHVNAVLTNLSEVSAMIEAQKLRALAVTTLGRLDALKGVPRSMSWVIKTMRRRLGLVWLLLP
jgi:tripartite-type tricarboxylate transporter receptor subunit TctC